MAKKKSSGINKSEELRKYLGQNPGATAPPIIPDFAERGIEIKPSLINFVKQQMKQKAERAAKEPAPMKKTTVKKKSAKKKRTSKKTTAKKFTPATSPTSKLLTADDLVESKKLVDELGGMRYPPAILSGQ